MNQMQTATQAAKAPQVHQAMDELGRKITTIEECSGQLLAKFEPVLRMEPQLPPLNGQTEVSFSTPLAEQMQGLSGRLSGIIVILKDLIDRVEV
jgi:hypothetical protein